MLRNSLLAATAALSGLLAAAPAFAFDVEEYNTARALFLEGTTGETTPKAIMDGLNGDWAGVGATSSDAALAVVLEKTCQRRPTTFASLDDMHFTESLNGGKVVATYTLQTGNTFTKGTLPEQVYAMMGFDKLPSSKNLDRTKESVMRFWQGTATLFRPSPNVLVIQLNQSAPVFYVRCP